MFKKVKKKLLGKNYQRFRLKKILMKIFGDAYLNKRRKWHYLKKKFSFFKNKLDNTNLGGQKITKTERGFLIDATIDNYLTYHLKGEAVFVTIIKILKKIKIQLLAKILIFLLIKINILR